MNNKVIAMDAKTTPDLIDALVLVIDDDVETTGKIRESLEEFRNVKVFNDGEEALAFCRVQTPDIVLLDVNMPALDGWAICKEIREMSMLSRCPIIFLSDDKNVETELKAWEAGGSDFLRKPLVMAALKMRVMSHLTSHWHIEISNRLYHTDTLTGLNNRYYYDKHVKEQMAYAERYNSDLSLLIIDINDFTRFNEKYGYAMGDKAIKKIASALKETVNRKPDSVCRYGGEEFTILLPGTNEQGAKSVSQRLMRAASELCIPFEGSYSEQLTINIGLASMTSMQKSDFSLFDAADKNLTEVKSLNTIQVA